MCIRDSSYRLAKENMEEATKLREAYVNKKSKERQFAVGDRCLVHFPNVKPGQNQKFTSRWKGVYTVVAVVGTPRTHTTGQSRAPTAPRRTESAPEAKATQGPDQTQEPTST